MTDLRTAAQQALEALEQAKEAVAGWGSYASEYFQQKHDLQGDLDAIQAQVTALRAALAEPEYPLGRATTDVGVPVYVLKKAEPVQEPVWIQPDHLQKARQAPFLCRVEPTRRFADFVPLYTAPPQRKPLTDEEIKQLLFESAGMTVTFSAVDLSLARAIERAHGIT